MMKIACVSNIPAKDYVVNSNIDIISYEIPAYSLFGMNGIGGNTDTSGKIKHELKRIGDAGKHATLAVIFGGESGDYIYNNYPYLNMVKRAHHGKGIAQPMKLPVFFDAGYIQKVQDTITWLADELKKDAVAYSVIENVKVGACQTNTPEMDALAEDWSTAGLDNTAYDDAAAKWKTAGFTFGNAFTACTDFIILFRGAFSDKNIIQPYIPLNNGFPCIDIHGEFCLAKNRPALTQNIIDWGNANYDFYSQYTAYVGTSVPDKYVQINRELLGTPKDTSKEPQFIAMLDGAKNQNIEYLEVFSENINIYKDIFSK
jgi:hypothetical protein